MSKKETKKHNIKVFSTSSCPWCIRAKQYLDQNKIEYTDVNIALDMQAATEMFKKSGQQGVPQLWIDEHVVVGFNKPVIDKLLNIN